MLVAGVQARCAAASVMSAHALAARQRQQLQQWRDFAARSQVHRAAVLAAQRVRAQLTLVACLHGWGNWAQHRQQQRAKLNGAATELRRRTCASVLAVWADAAGWQAAERSAALLTALERYRARSASAAISGWVGAAREGVAARWAAAAQLTAGLERCCLRDCFTGWGSNTAAAGRERAMLEAHAGRCRRRQLRSSFLAWADATRQHAAARDVLAQCLADNVADRWRAAVLAAWREAAQRSVYFRTVVTEIRYAIVLVYV